MEDRFLCLVIDRGMKIDPNIFQRKASLPVLLTSTAATQMIDLTMFRCPALTSSKSAAPSDARGAPRGACINLIF